MADSDAVHQVAGQHFTSPSLSVECGPEAYIAVTCAWFESPHTFTDYWRLSVDETNYPAGIEVRSDGALLAPCTVNLYGATPISSIEIYALRWDWSDNDAEERIEWDHGLLFHLQDNRRFCIWCQLDGPGIATEIHYTEDQELIVDVLKDATLRIRIGQEQSLAALRTMRPDAMASPDRPDGSCKLPH